MSYPNSAPITRAEKWWALALAVVSFPIGLIVLIGALADQGWARWFGLLLSILVAVGWTAAAFLLLTGVLPETSYPFGSWFVFLAALAAVLGLLAARTFLAGLRSEETE